MFHFQELVFVKCAYEHWKDDSLCNAKIFYTMIFWQKNVVQGNHHSISSCTSLFQRDRFKKLHNIQGILLWWTPIWLRSMTLDLVTPTGKAAISILRLTGLPTDERTSVLSGEPPAAVAANLCRPWESGSNAIAHGALARSFGSAGFGQAGQVRQTRSKIEEG